MPDEKRPILLCLDLEAGSEELARHAAIYAKSMNRPMHVLYVLPDRSPETEPVAQARLKRFTDATMEGLEPESVVVRRGCVEEEIAGYIREKGMDMVILGHRQKARRERIYVGSSVRTVISLAPVPVLVVPIDKKDMH